MTIEIKMPALSPTMKDGLLSKWAVKAGDKIKPGMVIAEIETDKASMEVEAVDGGIIGKILVEAGTQGVNVGEVIALLLENGEDASAIEKYQPKQIQTESRQEDIKAVAKTNSATLSQQAVAITDNRVIASPLAKRIASDSNIDLSKIDGTGPNGRIIKKDLENISSSSVNEGKVDLVTRLESKVVPHNTMRKVIASRLLESKTQSPHFYLSIDCNMTALLEMRKKMNDGYNKHKGENSINISVNDLFVKAAGIALQANPGLNVSWTENEMIHHGNIDISIAVSIPGGLVTPIIKNADKIGIIELSHAAKNLIKKAREGKLLPHEFQGGTFSVSNLGMYGIKEFYPIINPPQAAILSISATHKKPVVNEAGEVVVADICNIGLSVDHRAVDGAAAAQYLQFLKMVIENPMMLSL